MKNSLVILILISIILLSGIIATSNVEAAWKPDGESGEVTYEVKPSEKIVHVRYIYTLKNLDLETLISNSYYYAWPVWVPADAININIGFTHLGLKQVGQYKIITIPLLTQLSYGRTESFVIQYDLKIDSPNNIEFLALTDTYKADLQIVLPRGYFNQVWLNKAGYVKEETQINTTIYKYSINKDGRDFSVMVELFREAKVLSLSNTIKLREKNVNIVVNYWEGELNKAKELQGLVIKSFPVLEKIIGIPFPQKYPILITQSTSREINRWGGVNRGEKGIFMPYEGGDLNEVLLHELSHYWATKPPYAEDWMHEGQAELYAYIALSDLLYQDEARQIRLLSQQTYDQGKNRFDLPLAELIIPKTITDENNAFIDFAYTKSFLFMLNLYENLGLENIQKANREVFASRQTVNWFEYLNILENVSGQNLQKLFAEWILPKTFTQNYGKFISIQNYYKQLYSMVSGNKDSIGIQRIERETSLLSELISQGQFSEAENKIQSVRKLYDQWQIANRNYVDMEKIILQSSGGLGIGAVNEKLKTARELLLAGQYDHVPIQAQFVSSLYEQWKNAERMYRETEKTISQSEKGLGIETVSNELKIARELLLSGQYNRVSARVESALKLYNQWLNSEKAYREASIIISPNEGAQGISAVSRELKVAQDLLLSGQYNMVSSKVDSALKLFERWQNAEKAYKEANNIISSYKGNLGIVAVNKEMKTATDLLTVGKYPEVSAQVRYALKIFEQWKYIYKDFRSIEESVSKFSNLLGIGIVESEFKIIKGHLEKGELEKADTQILLINQVFKKWKDNYEAYTEAQQLFVMAKEDNRTWGLEKAERLILEGEALVKAGNLDLSMIKFRESFDKSNQAITPFRAIIKFVALFSLILLIFMSVFFVQRRLKRKQV